MFPQAELTPQSADGPLARMPMAPEIDIAWLGQRIRSLPVRLSA